LPIEQRGLLKNKKIAVVKHEEPKKYGKNAEKI
jgi:hypothetical protein